MPLPTRQHEGWTTNIVELMRRCGFHVRAWREARIYIDGYGRDISAYLEPPSEPGAAPLDNCPLIVRSNWRAPNHNGLRCKGVKHQMLTDLFKAELILTPPPDDWRHVLLDDRAGKHRVIRPLSQTESVISAE